MTVQYVVKDEHTLGTIHHPDASMMQVLQGNLLRGGHDWKNGPVSVGSSMLRTATLADFETYRVLPPPHMRKSIATA